MQIKGNLKTFFKTTDLKMYKMVLGISYTNGIERFVVA